jgi:GAF domain-containing protein
MDNHSEQGINQGQGSPYQPVVESVSRITGLPASVWVLDEERQGLRIEAAVGLPADYVRDAFLALGEESVAGEAYRSGEVTIAYDVLSDPRWKYKDRAREMGWESVLCVPIQVRGAVIGVISIYAFEARDFSDLEKGLLTNYAAQIELTTEADRRGATLDRLLEAAQEIERWITEQPQAVLEEIVKAACQVTDASCAVLYPYDPHREDFYDIDSVAAYGLSKPLQLAERPRRQTGMAAYVRREGEVVVSNIEEEDPTMLASPFISREGVKAFMGIALQVGAEVLGILYMNFRTPHLFDEGEKDTIRLFAHQAALAIHNSRSYQRAENRAEALKKLHEVSLALVSISGAPEGLRTILTLIVQNAQSVLGAALVDIYQYVQSEDRYVLPPIQVGQRYEPVVAKDRIYEDDVVCTVVGSRKPQYIAEAQVEASLVQPYTVTRPDAPPARFVIRQKIASSAAVPLIAGTEVMGVLFANYRSPQTFPQEQQELIELFARQAAIAIRNARLSAQTQERLEQLVALNDISKLLMEEREARETVRLLMQRTLSLFNFDQGSFWFVDYAHNRVNLIFSIDQYGEVTDWYGEAEAFLPLERDSSIAGNTAVTGTPNLWNAVSECPYWNPRFDELTGYKTERILSVPLLIPIEVSRETDSTDSSGAEKVKLERAIGVLEIVNPVDDTDFTEEDRGFLVSIARMAAIAMHNAEIHEHEVALGEIGRVLTRGARLREDEVLELVHQYAGRVMDTDNMYVALYDEPTDTVRFGLALVGGRRVDVKTTEEGWQPRQAGKGRTEEIIHNRRPILISTKAEAEAWYERPGREDYIKEPAWPSWMGVPMMAGQRVVGVIATYNPTWEYVYSIDDLEILQAMANQAAIALDNARLFYDVNRRLESLIEIDRLVASSIGVKEGEILELIHGQASKLMDADNMYIALYRPDPNQMDEYNPENPEQSEIYGTVEFGLAFKDGERIDVGVEKGWQPRRAGRGRAEEIIRTKKPILIATKAEAEAWYEGPGREDDLKWEMFPSWLGVPMMVGEKMLGVIATYHPTLEHVYSGDNLEILQAMATQAAIALDKSALYQRAEKHGVRLETARHVASVIARELDLKDCLERILDVTTDLLGARYATIQLVDEATGELVVHAQKGLKGKRGMSDLYRIKMGRGVTGLVAQERRTIRTGNVKELPYYENFFHKGTRSEMATPLVEHDKVIGVLNVEDPRENAFSEDDEELFKLLAEHVVIAIQNARRVEALREEQERRVEMESSAYLGYAANGVAHRINNTIALLPLCVDDIRRQLPTVPQAVDDNLAMIARNAQYILDLAEEFQRPSKPSEAGLFDINLLVQEAVDIVSPQAITVATRLDDNLPKVQTKKLLIDVFVELITNAVGAMAESEEKVLEIGSRLAEDNSVEVWFTDTGEGVPGEERERLFELFYTTAKKGEPDAGVAKGIGLWWIKTFLAWQHGTIRVESLVGKGTTFVVKLPIEVD